MKRDAGSPANRGFPSAFPPEARFAARLPARLPILPAYTSQSGFARMARLLHREAAEPFHLFVPMIDRLEQDLSMIRNAMSVRGYRQELLASNIANADTPHYKARDVDFKSALQSALGGRAAAGVPPVTLARTQAGHLGDAGASPHGGAVKYRTEYQGAVDGNTVNMDVERAAFAENAMQLEALITFINGRFRTLQGAIQGQ
jgi:flagellar basal-body rod protein FlgB